MGTQVIDKYVVASETSRGSYLRMLAELACCVSVSRAKKRMVKARLRRGADLQIPHVITGMRMEMENRNEK
jgi:hypothetical protein